MRLTSRLVERGAQEPPCSCLCKWRHTLFLQVVGCRLVVKLRLLDCSTPTSRPAWQKTQPSVHMFAQGNAAIAMLVQVPPARGVVEVLLHPLQEAVLTTAALPRGAAQARSAKR